MFLQIFKHELHHAVRQPSNWLFFVFFFLVGFAAMAMGADILGERNVEKGTELFANAPLNIYTLFKDLNLLILILLPAVIGGGIYRDFKSKMHLVLYSYSFSKGQYLGAKFAASILVMTLILAATGVGLWVAESLPFPHYNLLGATNYEAYFGTYFVYVLPNLLIFGAMIFTVVALSRNIYAGFITVIFIILIRAIIGSFLGGLDDFFLASILEPYGEATVIFHTRYWTLAEQNSLLIPLDGPVIWNRLVWLSIATVIFCWGFRKFRLEQETGVFFKFFERKDAKAQRKILGKTPSEISLCLPAFAFDFSILTRLKSIWHLSKFEFNYLFRSHSFLAVLAGSFIFMFVLLSQVNPDLTTRIKPLTQVMIFIPTFFFSMVIVLLTFLYSGVLIHRSRTERFDSILDATPVANWQLLLSKFLALVKMQIVLLSVIMIVGIFVQVMRGHYDFEIGLYLFDLYVRALPGFIIWTFLAMFVQTLLPNPMVNAFLLLLIFFGIEGLDNFGIENDLFKYNAAPILQYSDLDGYGSGLTAYFLMKIYWFWGGLLFFFGTYLFWNRGLTDSFSQRIRQAKNRFRPGGQVRGKTVWGFALSIVIFLGLGSFIFLEKNKVEKLSAEAILKNKYQAEVNYSKFKNTIQPRISGAKINMHLFPKTRDYQSDGEFILKNKSTQTIDTILVKTSFEDLTEVNLNRKSERIISDSIAHFEVFKLKTGLLPGDSLRLFFKMKNKPNSIFETNSQIAGNGTFYVPNFPTIGAPEYEIENAEQRKEFGLSERGEMALPPRDLPPPPLKGGTLPGATFKKRQKNITNSSSSTQKQQTAPGKVPPLGGGGGNLLQNYYAGKNIDFLNFEATVSTSADQIALAPGKLQKEWTEGNRRFFQYKTKNPIRNGIVFNSGRFEVKKEKWRDVDLEIYYHPAHDFNLESMMNGMKATLEFCTENFAPYQFQQMRIVEFPRSYGRFAQAFAGTIPYSEFAGFIANVDSAAQNRYDSPFRLTTHEMSHLWWGHQLVPADVRGSKLVTEGLAEYSSLKILEKNYGKKRMRIFLKLSREAYLRGRSKEQKTEHPLWCAEHGQNYLNYNKGALAFYLLSDYLGEDVFHKMLKTYVDNFRLQDAPYPTSVNLIDIIRSETPDSLQYLITDLFEKSVLYDNRVVEAKTTKLQNGKYQVDLEFIISKYRNGEGGERIFSESKIKRDSIPSNDSENGIQSLLLKDYVEIGIFNKKGEEIYLRKHKITEIQNQVSIIVDELPKEVGIDPWLKLIDIQSEDNRLKT